MEPSATELGQKRLGFDDISTVDLLRKFFQIQVGCAAKEWKGKWSIGSPAHIYLHYPKKAECISLSTCKCKEQFECDVLEPSCGRRKGFLLCTKHPKHSGLKQPPFILWVGPTWAVLQA